MFRPGTDIVAFTTGGSERIRVDDTGQVGIGTPSPEEALDVVGRIQASDQILTFTTDNTTTPGFSWTGDTDTGMFRADPDVIAFSTAGLERMRVDDVGNVGIGVSNIDANSALHVDGDVRLQNADQVGACNIYTKTEVDDLIEDVDDNLAEGLFWDTETQRLGVSTNTPEEALDVLGRIQASDQVLTFVTDEATTPGFSWTGDTDTGMFRADSDVIAFSTAGLERMRVDDVGNVGIGISNIEANSALHVDGDVRLRNSDLVGACNIYTKTQVDDLIEDVDDNLAEGLFWDTETNRLGVGTVEPEVTLDVSGDARVTGNVDCDTLFVAQRLSVLNSVGVPYLTGASGGGGLLEFRNAQDDNLLLRLSNGTGLKSFRNLEVEGDVIVSGDVSINGEFQCDVIGTLAGISRPQFRAYGSSSLALFNNDTVRPFKNETTILRLRSYFFLMLS
jgi:hypothetical protein